MNMDGGHKVDTQGVYLTQTFKVLSGEILSITGYREQVQRFPSTYTGESFLTLFDSTRNTERYTTQQEFRYVSDFDGPFNFVTGGNYFRDAFNIRAMFSVGLTSLMPNLDRRHRHVRARRRRGQPRHPRALRLPVPGHVARSREEYAVYWDGSYEITDAFKVTAGIRYSQDEKDFLRYVDGGGPCTALTDPLDIKLVDGNCTDTRSQYTSRAGILPNQWDGRHIPLPLSALRQHRRRDRRLVEAHVPARPRLPAGRLGHALPQLRDRLPLGRLLRDLRHPDALRIRPRNQRQHRARLQGRPVRQHVAPERGPVPHELRRPAARRGGDLHGSRRHRAAGDRDGQHGFV